MAEHILYVFAASKRERRYQLQMESLAERGTELTEHDIVVVEVFENEQGTIGSAGLPHDKRQELRQRYQVLPGQFKVVLVGRDLHIQLCAKSCISYEEIVMRIEISAV